MSLQTLSLKKAFAFRVYVFGFRVHGPFFLNCLEERPI